MRMIFAAAASLTITFSVSAGGQTGRIQSAGPSGGAVQGGTSAPSTITTKPGGASATPVRPPGGVSSVPLSPVECDNLGGEIFTAHYCASGMVCRATGQNGQTHEVCITKKQ